MKRKLVFRLALLAILAAAIAAIVSWMRGGVTEIQQAASFTAIRGPMEITVLEGGSIEAQDSLQIKCEVQGQTRILTLIDEGHYITPQDVADGLVLIELDSKELLDSQIAQELEYQSSLAAFTEAKERYEIQQNQNESDISQAELTVYFAKVDLEKYLGETVAMELLKRFNLLDGEEKDVPHDTGVVDFSEYAHPDKLGDGEARQKLRQLEGELTLSQEDIGLAETKLEGTKRLLTRNSSQDTTGQRPDCLQQEADAQESANTSYELFIKYEFRVWRKITFRL